MSTMRFPERRPYLFTIIIEVTVVAVYLAAGTADHFLALSGLAVYALANSALALILAVVVTRLHWWGRIGFRRATPSNLLLVLPVLLPAVVNFYPGVRFPGFGAAAGFLLLALAVGFVEETAFRGLMLRALEPLGVWRAVIITTILFSVTHLMNVMAGEAGLQAALQLLYTAAVGFAFAALVLRTGTIWPLIVAHALIDFVAFMGDPALVVPPAAEIGIDITVTAAFVAYGLFVLGRRPVPVDHAHLEGEVAATH